MDKKLRIALVLSWCIAVLYLFPKPLPSIILNIALYIVKPVYREGNALISPEPLLSLIVGVLFIVCLIYVKRGTFRARLIWLGFLIYFVYSSAPFLLTLNPQRIVIFSLSLYSLIVGVRSHITEETHPYEIGIGIRRITEAFLWFLVLSICLGWSLLIAKLFVVIHYKWATVINGIISLAVVVPLLIYTAVSLHKKREIAPLMAAVLLLAAGLAGLVTFHYVPVFYYLRYPEGGPMMDITHTFRYLPVSYNIPILIAYNVYHAVCLLLAGVFLFRFKKGVPAGR